MLHIRTIFVENNDTQPVDTFVTDWQLPYYANRVAERD